MLTDVVLGEVNGRKYILTADRDEHIRVSRGIPQTYVIEGFCLGHTEFVSRLCVPSTCPEVLISGGGDDELVVWEWLAGRRISAVDISSHINEVLEGRSETIKPAISSIQHMLQNATNTDIIVVASEGIPALFIFKLLLTPHPHIQHTQTITLPGNVLSVVLVEGHEERILVSIDTIHKPCSTCERREENDAPDSIFLLTSHGEKFVLCETVVKAPEIMDVDFEKAAVGRLGNLLYSLENLRKREGDGTDD
jgi:tRNA (guanine-N(7)-)-methyltransferase subunit TRM82